MSAVEFSHSPHEGFSASPSAADRAYAQNSEPAYWPDIADGIDTEEEILADMFGVTLAQAQQIKAHADRKAISERAMLLGQVVGLLLNASNVPAMAHAIALAAGLDQLNGKHSQEEIARQLGCTRALLSHYVVGVSDLLSGQVHSFECLKFRKRNSARKVYAEKATDKFTAARKLAIQKYAHSTN
jgi:hypothetical protein